MAFRKGDRVVLKHRGRTALGHVRDTGAVIEITLDDGSGAKAPAINFRASEAPIPKTSPFHDGVTEIGAAVDFRYEDEWLSGVVHAATPIEAVVHANGFAYTVSQAHVRRAGHRLEQLSRVA